MNHEEALVIVETLSQESLSKLQMTVFRHAWEEPSYLKIAKQSGYEVGYVKQADSHLWQLLDRALGEKVTKNNVQLALSRFLSLFGMAGIGKTSLSSRCAKQIQAQFEHVIWRSLRNAPSIQFTENCLSERIKTLRVPRSYENMNITGVTNLTKA